MNFPISIGFECPMCGEYHMITVELEQYLEYQSVHPNQILDSSRVLSLVCVLIVKRKSLQNFKAVASSRNGRGATHGSRRLYHKILSLSSFFSKKVAQKSPQKSRNFCATCTKRGPPLPLFHSLIGPYDTDRETEAYGLDAGTALDSI